jgi:hypothetical protein
MQTTLVLALLAVAASPADKLVNIDFTEGNFKEWENKGFVLTQLDMGSSKRNVAYPKGRKASLSRTFVIPPETHEIHFSAATFHPKSTTANGHLDIVLESLTEAKIIPREVKLGTGWVASPQLLGTEKDTLRDHRWVVNKYAKHKVRLTLTDNDDRDECYLYSTGLRFLTLNQSIARQFAGDLRELATKHKLGKLARYDSEHFICLSTAGDAFSERRLYNCETMYDAFYPHFRKKGWELIPPSEKMQVAVFATQDGLNAALKTSLPPGVTGAYHPPSNRLFVYDFATQAERLFGKTMSAPGIKFGSEDLARERRLEGFRKSIREMSNDTNISTVMHEVTHQLAFNSGVFKRGADNPLWLVEGMAVYCEPTTKGVWRGIGEIAPDRIKPLVEAEADKSLIPLKDLIGSDNWLQKATNSKQVVLGYSQSWALFRMLIEENPKQLKAYIDGIYARSVPEFRFADFTEHFGSVPKMEVRHKAYVAKLTKLAPAKK